MTEVSEFHSDVCKLDVHIIFAVFRDKNVIYVGERVAKLLMNYKYYKTTNWRRDPKKNINGEIMR